MNNLLTKGSALSAMALSLSVPAIGAKICDEKQPNILFILVDDFRYDALGYCGNPIVHTPSIDNLAEKGVYFSNAFSSTPISSASRASILTGLYERSHRYSFQTGPLDDELLEQAYPLALREGGYNTALFGKLGVVCTDEQSLFDEIESYDRDDKYPDRRGYYNKVLGQDTVHLTRYTGQRGLDFLDKQDGETPFFLSLCFSAPHAHDGAKEQYFWDKEQDHLFEDVTIPDPMMSSDKDFERLPEAVKAGFSRLRWTWRFDTPEKYQAMMKGYYRMIAGVDAEVGKVLAKLKEKGMDKNTVVILLGDNGYMLGERQLADKWLMYDLSVRVPLVIYDPRVDKHSECDTQVLNVDVTATFADYAGVEAKPQWHGESLKDLASGKSADWSRDAVLIEHLWEFAPIPPSEGVRTDDWKYFRYVNDKDIEELYNIKSDPNEAKNLVDVKRYRSVLLAMRAKCDELIEARGMCDAPFNLMVDYCSKSEGAESKSLTPSFSWQLPLRAKSQKAYQILIASSQANLDLNCGDVWDSHLVVDDASTAVKYLGAALTEGKSYFWKVRVWDYLNRTTEYSAAQPFVASVAKKRAAANLCRVSSFECSNKELEALTGVVGQQAQQSLWGVEAVESDYSKVVIDPKMAGVTSSAITLDSVRGQIKCSYVRVSGMITHYTVSVPSNVAVDFRLPKGLVGNVLLNKRVLPLNHDVIQLEPGENAIMIQVNSF